MKTAVLCLYIAFLAMIGAVTVASADTAGSDADTRRDWTFLVYLNGNNNLDHYGAENIQQMERVGSTANINVVVQWASRMEGKAVRLLAQKNSGSEKVSSPIVQDLGRVDMGDYHSLIDFLQWGVTHYPAKHYFVDVWDHGNGWHLQNMSESLPGNNILKPFDISLDDITHHIIKTEELGMALAEGARFIGHKIDLYGNDACLMSMAEVAAEVAPSVQYFVGSEETEPAEGWPYDTILSQWDAMPGATAEEVSKILVSQYIASYSGGENGTKSVTFSAFDLSKVSILNDAVATLGRQVAALGAEDIKKVAAAANDSQGFALSDYHDLGDFMSGVQASQIAALDASSVAAVNDAISQFVVANEDTGKYAKSKGVAIWLPNDQDTFNHYIGRYKGLQFDVATHWDEALQYLTKNAPAQLSGERFHNSMH